MKRLAALILPLCLLFAACSKEPPVPAEDIAAVQAAVDAFNAATKRDTVFRLSIGKESEEEVLFFTSGNAAVKNDAPIAMSGRITQIEKGDAVTGDMFYKAGAYYYDNGYGKYYMEMKRESFLQQFFCTDVPFPETVQSLRKAESAGGLKYEFAADAMGDRFNAMFATDIYTAAALRKPNREKTAFSNAVYSYVVKDGALVSASISFDVALYETAAYYPNYTPTEEELVHRFSVTYELTVNAIGASVEIKVPKTEDYTFLN